MRYISPIDPHVHFRGEEYWDFPYKGRSFMALGFRDAKVVGLRAVIDMPNSIPKLTSEETINARLKKGISEEEINTNPRFDESPGDVYYGVYAGTTNDLNQVEQIATLAEHSRRNNGRIKGIKIYFVDSTENMGILDPEIQKKVWERIVKIGYKGPVLGHFEAQDHFCGEFDYKNPLSHSIRQNPESELVQVERQIKNAVDSGFEGTFYVVHASNPDTIGYLRSQKFEFPITIEMTWHHMFLDTNAYEFCGNGVKINPPLRDSKLRERNLEYVLGGRIDIIGTDHAPHPVDKKKSDKPPSGIPAIPFYPRGIELLRDEGINPNLLDRMLFHNANNLFFNGQLKPKEVFTKYFQELWEAYGYNPFLSLGI